MLKWQKKLIEDLVDTIESAIQHKLYNDCVAGLQTIVKNFPNDGLDVVCADFIKALFEVMQGNTQIDLLSQIEKIKSKISAIKCKKEVVFFPYQSSMWDSFDSVWREFSKDDEYETFVVPIPYFDIGQKGGTDIMLYDGNNLPKYVKIFDWKNYDIKSRNPDLAFIHNPYDDFNAVTRVHSDFFTTNLKKYCKKLVYIPYFVTNGVTVGKHFVLTPAVANSDYVIVDTEKIKEQYLKFIKEQCKNEKSKYDKLYWEKKILPLGSPKVDAITNAEVEIPESWNKYIYKSDGTKKIVVLYNISIGDMLQSTLGGSANYFKKIQKVFEYFENSEDMVLLFRPHPLMLQSVKSMRAPFLPIYLKLIDYYKSSQVGIFDDSSDLQRAIALSDFYYGDMSSLIELYKDTGKLIFMQNSDIPEVFEFPQKDRNLLAANCFDFYGDDIIFLNNNFSGLFKLNSYNFNIDFLLSPTAFKGYQNELFYSVEVIDNFAILLPKFANDVIIYNLSQKTVEILPLDLCQGSIYKFIKVLKIENKLYFIPIVYPAIIIYDLETHIIEKQDKWIEKFNRKSDKKFDRYFYDSIKFSDNLLMLISSSFNGFMIYNIENEEIEFIKVSEIETHIVHVFYDGEFCWLPVVNSDKIIKVNPTNKKYDVINLDFITKKTEFSFSIIGVEEIGDKIYFIDYHSENSFCIDKNTEKITKAAMFNKGLKISCVKKYNDMLYCSYLKKNVIVEFDGEKFTEILLTINGDEFSENYDFLTATLNTPKTNYGAEIYKFLRNK